MKDSTKQKIELVIKTLDSITVQGRNNLDMLLGCIITLEDVIKEEETE